MTASERSTAQAKGLRYSFPPYSIAMTGTDGNQTVVLPGDTYELLQRGLAPTTAEIRLILVRLRQDLHWSRTTLAAFLGVNSHVVRRWEMGERNPGGAARRLIWLLDRLVREPDKLKSAFDLMVWGRGEEFLKIGNG